MAGILGFEDAIDIGGGRGRLAAPAAASLARVDVAFRSAFGRAADINEAWRSPKQADENFRAYQAWLAYQAGRGPKVPWAPIGYAAKDSIHCRGYAVDTDDTSTRQMEIWNDHGWFWTVYRNGVLVERWHLEYDASRDNHKNDPAPAGNEDDMPVEDIYVEFRRPKGQPVKAGTIENLHINANKDISVARGAAKHIAGNLVVQISGGVPYKGAVQVTPVVRTVVAGKPDVITSLRAREIVFTGGETLGEVAVNCALQANQRLSFRVGGSSQDFTVVSATFRGMKLT